jgi:hypothetical protein
MTFQKGGKRTGGAKTTAGLDRTVWEAMLAEYRLHPAEHAVVARSVGVNVNTCRRYWLEGGKSTRRPWAAEPIKDIVERENLALRAELQLDRETAERAVARELGQIDAIRARADVLSERVSNVQMTRVLKAQVLSLSTMLQGVLDGVGGPAAEGLRAIFAGEAFLELAQSSPGKALAHVRTLVKLTKELAEVGEIVIKLERLLLGESTSNSAVAVQHNFETREDALAVIQRAHAASIRVQGAVIDVQASVVGSDAAE